MGTGKRKRAAGGGGRGGGEADSRFLPGSASPRPSSSGPAAGGPILPWAPSLSHAQLSPPVATRGGQTLSCSRARRPARAAGPVFVWRSGEREDGEARLQ